MKPIQDHNAPFVLPSPNALENIHGIDVSAVPELQKRCVALASALQAPELDAKIAICQSLITPVGPEAVVEDLIQNDTIKKSQLTYDDFFDVERLPKTASGERVVESLTTAMAIVLMQNARLQKGNTNISAIEFGILYAALGALLEAIEDIINSPASQNPTQTRNTI